MAKMLAHLDAQPVIRSWILLITLLTASFIFFHHPQPRAASPALVQTSLAEPLNFAQPTPTASAPQKTAHEAIAEWVCSAYAWDNGCATVLDMVVRVARAATERNIPAEIALGVVLKESQFNPQAVNRRSGDYGLMQVNYRWHQDKVANRQELLDPDVNIDVGMSILRDYATRERGNWARTLRRYNGLGGKNDYPAEVLGLAAHIRQIAAAHES